jgi:hypothetical protein
MRTMNLPALPSAPASPEQWADLFLSRADGGLMPFPEASHLLVAHAAWPNDQKTRDQYMATNVGLAVAHLERRLVLTDSVGAAPTNVRPEKLSGRSGLELFGGWGAVAQAALSSVLDRLDNVQGRWPQVADIFHAIIDIAHEKRFKVRGGPSISKAIDLVADAHGLPGRSQLAAVWSEFHDVAHVLLAGAYIAHCALERGERRAHSILSAVLLVPDIVLALAGAFQQFGLTTKPHGRNTPILNPETLWQVPESHVAENLFLPVRVLTQRQIDLLQARRASKKYRPSPPRS